MSLGFNIPISADPTGLKKDLDSAAKAALEAGAKIANGTNQAGEAVVSLQRQFRIAQKEALDLGQKYGLTSKAAVTAFQKAGELKDQIADSKKLSRERPRQLFWSFFVLLLLQGSRFG
jgi:hypothetical protein